MGLSQQSLLTDPVSPSLDVLLARNSACARLANLLIARRGQWVDGLTLAKVAGAYAWRTRLSELRQEPWFLEIDNRLRTVNDNGRAFRVSEYRLRVVP